MGLLSRTAVNSVTDAIKHIIEESISADINKAAKFTLLLDTTRDKTEEEEFCDFLVCWMQRPCRGQNPSQTEHADCSVASGQQGFAEPVDTSVS